MNEVEKERQLYVQSARNNYSQDAQTRTLVPANIYGEMLEVHVRQFSYNTISVEIDRARFTVKKEESNSISIVGDHNRIGTSNDHSVNVSVSVDPNVFLSMRAAIQKEIPEGDRQREVLDRLTALEKAQGTRSFGTRYMELMGVAADHVTVFAPFLPALVAHLQQVLK